MRALIRWKSYALTTLTMSRGARRPRHPLVLRAPLEALSEQRASLATLPAVFRLLIAGGALQFGKAKAGKRDAVAPGASERHSFDAPRE